MLTKPLKIEKEGCYRVRLTLRQVHPEQYVQFAWRGNSGDLWSTLRVFKSPGVNEDDVEIQPGEVVCSFSPGELYQGAKLEILKPGIEPPLEARSAPSAAQ